MAIRETTDEEYNQDGSYSYPPAPRSARQHIAFWETVPIPDAKLTAAIEAYKALREQTGMDAASVAVDAWKSVHPDPSKYTYKAAAEAERWSEEVGHVYDAAFAEAVSDMPEHIYRTSVRPLVRAHQMRAYATPLPAEERATVLGHELVVDGQIMTVEAIERTYRLSKISNSIL